MQRRCCYALLYETTNYEGFTMKFNDEVCTRTTINFSFSDKIRILLGRKVTVCVDVKTENVVGATETESLAIVEKFRKPKHETGGEYSYV